VHDALPWKLEVVALAPRTVLFRPTLTDGLALAIAKIQEVRKICQEKITAIRNFINYLHHSTSIAILSRERTLGRSFLYLLDRIAFFADCGVIHLAD
jgi:hypothetical protein